MRDACALSRGAGATARRARTYTGAGSYTDLSVPAELARIPEGTLPNAGHGPIFGPDILASELEHGACTQIYCEDGALTFMEIAAYGCEFPESLTNVRLLPVDDRAGAGASGKQP